MPLTVLVVTGSAQGSAQLPVCGFFLTFPT